MISKGNKSVFDAKVNKKTIKKAYMGSNLIFNNDLTDYLMFTALEDSEIWITRKGSYSTVKYTFGSPIWTELELNTHIELEAGTSVYFKGQAHGIDYPDRGTRFAMSGKIAASGSIMSLLENDPNATTISYPYAAEALFAACTALVSAPRLPATTLTGDCYKEMFQATGITEPPELPARSIPIRAYYYMFRNCQNLVRAVDINATSISTYGCLGMFSYCPKITRLSQLTCTYVSGQEAYGGMFKASTGIKVSATQDDEYSIPYSLPTGYYRSDATKDILLNTGGTYTGDITPGVTYYEYDSSKEPLNFVAKENLTVWLNAVGTISDPPEIYYKIDNGQWTSYTIGSAVSIPENSKCYWKNTKSYFSPNQTNYLKFVITNGSTSGLVELYGNIESLINYAELSPWCFAGLFFDNKGIISLPKFNSTTLKLGCYYGMFRNCTGLKLSTTQSEDYSIPFRIPSTGTATTATAATDMMFLGTGGTFKGTPQVNTTYYLSYTSV